MEILIPLIISALVGTFAPFLVKFFIETLKLEKKYARVGASVIVSALIGIGTVATTGMVNLEDINGVIASIGTVFIASHTAYITHFKGKWKNGEQAAEREQYDGLTPVEAENAVSLPEFQDVDYKAQNNINNKYT